MFNCCTLKPKSVTMHTVTKVLGLQSCLLYKENFKCCCKLTSYTILNFLSSPFFFKEERLNKGKNFNSTEFAIISLP
uniref:Uncharacterized protein n=1 Tax=Cebus imitator TaxID=2715852 RepID=A0A2K5PKR0_CEBIM